MNSTSGGYSSSLASGREPGFPQLLFLANYLLLGKAGGYGEVTKSE